MKKSLICAVALCFAVGAVIAQPADAERLPADAQVRVGKLDNGMTYYIRHHRTPERRADFFIAHDVGALQEEDNQDGLAHFLEHMAFNGTTNFPKKSLLNYLASIGVRFGYNVNAYTTRDRTVYNVSNVPLTRDGIVDSLMLIMHDWSHCISCDPEEVEAERGVIREEWRRGYDARTRMSLKTNQFEYEGSKYAKRDVIGDPEIINTFERQTLVDFYHKWYRPDLQAVIVVGDVDVDKTEALIRRVMSEIPKANNPAPKESYDLVDLNKPRYGIISDPEIKATSMKLIYRQPYPTPEERTTVASVRQALARAVFLELIRARQAELDRNPGAGYKRVVPVLSVQATCRQTFQLTALPKQSDLYGALAGMLVDVERVRRYGFTEAEFEAARTRVVRAEKVASEKLRQATNTELAKAYIEHFTRNVPYMTFEQSVRITEQELEGLTFADVNALKDEMTQQRNMLVIASLPEQDLQHAPSEREVFALLDSVAAAKIEPMGGVKKNDGPLFTEKVTPGRVVREAKAPFEAVEWTLANGVKVFWRTLPEVTDRRKIGMTGVVEGAFARDSDAEGMRLVQNFTRWLGVGGLDRDQMRNLLVEHDAHLLLGMDKTSASISGSVSPADFELLLQLTHLYITKPNFSDEAYGRFIDQCRSSLSKESGPKTIYSDSSSMVKYAGHPWLKPVTLSTLDRVDAKAARSLYDKVFGNAADYVFFFAGEMPADEARPLIEKYIGSLPVAARQKYPEVAFEIAPGVKDYEYVAQGAVTPKSSIERIYHGKFNYTPADYATLRYLTYILGARYMKSVREEKGGTYYIGVQDEVSARPGGYCRLVVSFDTDPRLCEMLLAEVQKGIEDLASKNPSGQEVQEAMLYFRKANAERRQKSLQTTNYWLDKMSAQYFDGVELDKDNEAVFMAVTPDRIRRLARDIVSQNNRFTTIFTQK